MGKTERILNNLPATFRPFPRPSSLFTLANAYGSQLQEAENLLVEVMRAHWVDFADLGREEIRDLKLLVALYGLEPRPDESVEEFREHLKRYVRTFLQGTATVRGILRIAADTLGLSLDEAGLETPPYLRRPGQGDAARLVLGLSSAEARGQDAQPARVFGSADLSAGLALWTRHSLRLKIDGQEALIDFQGTLEGGEVLSLNDLVQAINAAFGFPAAGHDGQRLILTTPSAGAGSRIEFLELEGPDAADPLFGIPPRSCQGEAERGARVTGQVDLSGGVDLSQGRFLRLAVDDVYLAEVDCAGEDSGSSGLDDICQRINAALGIDAAQHDGRFLSLVSPSSGSASRIEIQQAAAGDAAETLLGPAVQGVYSGTDARPAQLIGRRPLSGGADLSTERVLVLKIDEGEPVPVDCAGETPEQTSLAEIVARINAALGQEIASSDGVHLILTSTESGESSRLEVLTAPEGDASERILGFAPRVYQGQDARRGRIEGQHDLRPGLDLRWRRFLQIESSATPSLRIDLAGSDPAQTSPEEIAQAINQALEPDLASVEDGHLVLETPAADAASWVAVASQDRTERTRFATRAPLREEASQALFGFLEGQASGEPARPPRLTGTIDLSRGADLRQRYYLRLGLDGQAPVDIDCRGARPRLTRLSEIVEKINAALGAGAARADGPHLVLESSTAGPAGSILVEPSTAGDASELLFGASQVFALGSGPERVIFTGVRDLSAGLDVSERYLIKIGIDEQEPAEIDLRAGAVDGHIGLVDIVRLLNQSLGPGVASVEGATLKLWSQALGGASRLAFEVPSEPDHDATLDLFGIPAPRVYTGREAAPAELRGLPGLSEPLDLSQRRWLRLGVDEIQPLDIDVGGTDPASQTLAGVAAAINAALGMDAARAEPGQLILTSPTAGLASLIVLAPSTAADASGLILGEQTGVHRGEPASPAVLTGDVRLLGPLDLSGRSRLRLAVDGGPPQEVDVAGQVPGRTFSDEVTAAINRAFPGNPALVSLDPQDRLQLTAQRSVSVLPLRYLTLYEHPAVPVLPLQVSLVHAGQWTVENGGVDTEAAQLRFTARQGVVGPAFTNWFTGARVRYPGALGPGQTLEIGLGEDGQLAARIDGAPAVLDELSAPEALLLFPGRTEWQYTECHGSRFDYDHFDQARYAGGRCQILGVFDLSRFAGDPDDPDVSVFAADGAAYDAGRELVMTWQEHRPGRFELELPSDLPRKFGARFDEGRFADRPVEPQGKGLFFEIEPLPGSILAWLNEQAAAGRLSLLEAEGGLVPPEGFVTHQLPLPEPVPFEGGSEGQPARLLLTEAGLDGYIELRASAPGAWGNRIQVALAEAGEPGAYDLTVAYDGEDVFENAVQKVQAQLIPARAAGVESSVTRPASR